MKCELDLFTVSRSVFLYAICECKVFVSNSEKSTTNRLTMSIICRVNIHDQ